MIKGDNGNSNYYVFYFYAGDLCIGELLLKFILDKSNNRFLWALALSDFYVDKSGSYGYCNFII